MEGKSTGVVVSVPSLLSACFMWMELTDVTAEELLGT